MLSRLPPSSFFAELSARLGARLSVLLIANPRRRAWLACLLLVAVTAALYAPFLHNPIVFDDLNFFDGADHSAYVNRFFCFDLRWMVNASFEWTHLLVKEDMVWQRLENLTLHCANALLLFYFLNILFRLVQGEGVPAAGSRGTAPLSSFAMAFFAALIFALHPASVYAVAYLVQRTSLMATFFCLLMWISLLLGVLRGSSWRILLSALAYGLGVLCKEHAIMAPAVAAAMLLLLYRQQRLERRQLPALLGTFVLYALIAAYIVYKVKSGNIIGQAYQANGRAMLAVYAQRDPGFKIGLAYPLSILTQLNLFFKYLLIWIFPHPAWMSVDMPEAFALRFGGWRLAGMLAFAVYPLLALALIWRRGKVALFGFGMLCPWLLFLTEVSTVRIQEIFVIYRSYLWMPLAFLCLPLLFQKTGGRRAAWLLGLLIVVMLPASRDRLVTFSHDYLLWDDAARLVVPGIDRQGMERIYKNRALALLNLGFLKEAIDDNTLALKYSPTDFIALNNRGVTYFEAGRYQEAMRDFDRALQFNPSYERAYMGRGRTFEVLHNEAAAQADYRKACRTGLALACSMIKPPPAR